MIKIADLPIVRAQLAHNAAPAGQDAAIKAAPQPAAAVPATPPRSMVLTGGKYYVTETKK